MTKKRTIWVAHIEHNAAYNEEASPIAVSKSRRKLIKNIKEHYYLKRIDKNLWEVLYSENDKIEADDDPSDEFWHSWITIEKIPWI